MKQVFFILSVILFFAGCKLEDSIVSPNNQNKVGEMLLKFESSTIPSGIVMVTATLTRQEFNTIAGNLNILSDSTAEISIQNIAVGIWHLLVQAKDLVNVVRYSGETDVDVVENSILQVFLTLVSTGTGTGGINILVNWSNPRQSLWDDYQNNPILSPNNSAYDNQGVSQAKIYFDGTKYMMWYVGLANSMAHTLYAESQDGINWSRPISSPVLSPGIAGTWDSWAVAPGPVIKDGETYRMYYLGYSNPNDQFHIGLATSSDGKVWHKYPTPVLVGSSNWERQISPHSILKIDSVYYLYYIGRSQTTQDRIGVAFSNDGISWSKYSGNPIVIPTQSWEVSGVSWPSVIYENGIFKMVYMKISSVTNAFGMATSTDGKTWTKLSNNPIFRAQNTYNGWAYNDISYPGFLKTGNEYRIYYSGWNQGMYKIGFTRLIQ